MTLMDDELRCIDERACEQADFFVVDMISMRKVTQCYSSLWFFGLHS
jgi:hypothetical protein